jgi:serine/threonine protein kinase
MSLPSAKKRKIFDGRYEVMSIVGRGLDSVVYHARHLSGAQHEVALKVLLNNKAKNSVTERLRKEALTLVSCRHKYVVRLDDFHSVADLCYLSMEYAPFGDLRKYMTAQGAPLSAEVGTEFLRQSLEAMEFIHATGVIHRDIKPDNILVITQNEIRLADFGLALLPGDELDLEELKNGVGSLSYLPPELLHGKFYDSRSDLYSLGVCFYEAMAGFHPFENVPLSEQDNARLDRNIKPLHEINPNIPRHVSAVVATLMRNSVEDRFQSAMEALRALSNPSFDGSPANSNDDSITSSDDELSSDKDAARHDPATQPSGYTPANVDEPLDAYTDDFDDFFKGTEYGSPATVETPTHAAGDTTLRDTEEMSAQRVQQLINQEKNKVATAQRKPFVVTPSSAPHPITTPLQQEPAQGGETDDELPGVMVRNSGLLSLLLTMHPVVRALLVGSVAALVTIGVVALSHVKPAELIAGTPSSLGSEPPESADVESTHATEDFLFPHLPAGTYSGAIQGILPGSTYPLALISRPEQNEITIVIGIEGWTPTTISTKANEKTSSTIVVRSNSVLLNMTGSGSATEIDGTFTNPITGESGVWGVKKLS